MFDPQAIPAIVIRAMISLQLSCSYPLVNHFQRVLLITLFFKGKTVETMPDLQFKIINITISLIPLIFALFYPNIGTVLSYAASISGFFMIYVVPVMAYMKLKKIEI